MGYISHTKVLSSCMLRFLPYHEKLGEVLSNSLCSLYLYNSAGISDTQHQFFFMLITFKRSCSNHVMNSYVIYFIISIEVLYITTSILHVDVEVINKKVGNIC